MKKSIQLLAVGVMIASSCSVSQAQIGYSNSTMGATLIYSNGFDGTAGVNIATTTPDISTNILGGTLNPTWLDVLGASDTNAFFANGYAGTLMQDSILLPFTPQANQVYTLTLSINYFGNPGSWIGAGFCQNYAHQTAGNGRFTDAPTGYDWGIMTESSGALSWWAGSKTGSAQPGGSFNPHTGLHTLTFILDTTPNQNAANKWSIASFLDGTQLGTNFTYAANPTLGAVGITETSQSTANEFQFTSFTLYAAQFLLVRPPATATVNQGANFTNTVIAGGTPPFSYQWYNNGVALANSGNVSGATTNALVITGVLPGNASSDYYVVVTNLYGAVTSGPASLTVLTSPTFTSAYPVNYTNVMTLFGATNIGGTNYPGSSVAFSVSAAGAAPIGYRWLTNGVIAGGATSATFSYTNCQLNSATNFACVASNSLGQTTNTWGAQYISSPTAPYPTRVMADGPVAYWRLNETNSDPAQYNNGQVCDDYIGGNNGIYTNTELAATYLGSTVGYDQVNDPADTGAIFGYDLSSQCDAYSILGPTVDFSGPTNAEFTVSVWANGGVYNGSAEAAPSGMVSKGYFNGEEFSLDNGAAGGDARFEVRNGVGTAINANSTRQLGGDNTWHHLVGVCDETNGVVNLYIDGTLAGQASITPGSGVILDPALPIMIGSRPTAAGTGGNNQFVGALNDVAMFNYAMTPAQVAALYGGPISPYFVQLPQTNILFTASGPLTIPAAAFGGASIGYYWTNLNTATVIASGSTNNYSTLNATLTLASVPGSWSGDQLELVVTNAAGSTNLFTYVFTAPLAQILSSGSAIIYSNSFALSAGGGWSINGTQPTAINAAFNTNATWICIFTNSANSSLGGTVYANGYMGTNAGNAVLPFTPQPGYIYTMAGTLSAASTMGDWVAMGFTSTDTQNGNNPGLARFTDTPPTGYTWMYVQNASSVFFAGPGTTTTVGSLSTLPLAPVTDTMQLVLNTSTYGTWTASSYANGTQVGTNAVFAAQPISYAGIGQNLNPGVTQWNYWTLSQQQVVSLVPTNIMVTQSNNNLYLSWPTDHLGWQLQVQTNALNTGIGTNWANVAASALTNQVVVPVIPANGAVFYRLLY
jgi:hypothetical protein